MLVLQTSCKEQLVTYMTVGRNDQMTKEQEFPIPNHDSTTEYSQR